MWVRVVFGLAAVYVVAAGVWVVAAGFGRKEQLLNVACDPTRELWRDVNAAFAARCEQERGVKVAFRQSHGGSGSQARAVIDGLPADVATLALWTDTDAIRKAGLIDSDWETRYPNRSLPFVSTIVFVVRRGNPKGVRDWPDLTRPDVEVVTPNPKTSGNGKWSFMALWGSVVWRGGTAEEARAFVTRAYRRVPVLDAAARAATITFAQKKIGDVHLTWENEALLEVKETGGALQVVYPGAETPAGALSVLAEPHVAVVDANVRRKGTAEIADAYVRFMYTDEAQELIARNGYRPTDSLVYARHRGQFPEMDLRRATTLVPSGNWEDVQKTFFAEGAVFDQIQAAGRK
jgi:sulfate transport system substrate-binding protein